MKLWKSVLAAGLLLIATSASAQNSTPLGPPKQAVPASPVAAGAPRPSPSASPASHSLTRADADTWLDGYMPYALRSGDIPGAVVTIVKDGQILTARGFGYADLDKRIPVDPERTLFRPGSVSKLVTWTAVMQMVEQHKLDLDHDINAYLDFKIPPFDGKPITLRQIMTHTGGFEEASKGIIFYDGQVLLPLETYLKRWTPTRIFAPGTTPAYSNWATALAAYMVQRASGEPFDAYVERHIFAPLGMRNSTFRQPVPANIAGQMAVGYPKVGEPSPGFEFIGPAPAGALASSGTDMARFMIAHLQNGALDGQRIFSPATAAMMHDSPLGPVSRTSLIPPLNRMELGFFETNINGHEVIGHLGDTSAFHTSLHLFIKDGVGLYVSFNSPGKAGAVGPLRNALFVDFADRYFPDIAPPDGRVDARTAADHARMMAGTWVVSRRSQTNFVAIVSDLFGQAKVAVGSKDELVIPTMVAPNGRPRQWVEIAPFVWRDRNGHDRLAAKLVDGKPVRWSMDQLSPFEVFDRAPAARSSAWILPALYVAIPVLLLTFLAWPAGWWTRRHYNAPLRLERPSLKAYRATRLMAGLAIALIAGWSIAISAMFANLENLAGTLDPLVMALQVLGAIILVGMVLVAAWNLWRTWTDGRRWARKLWSLLILLASLLVLYVAATFGLLAMTVNY